MSGIPILLAAEDLLSEAVLRRLLAAAGRGYFPGACYGKRGYGYLKANLPRFNQAARWQPFLILVDLDSRECAPLLRDAWLPAAPSPNLLFRVAVREVEAWLLADRAGFARFAGIRLGAMPNEVDALRHPKAALLQLVARSRRVELRADMLPRPGSTSTIGPNYNGRLGQFVAQLWDVGAASLASQSLARTVQALAQFRPQLAAEPEV